MREGDLEFKKLSIMYCDLSSKNDQQLRLLSSMLLKLNDVLEVAEMKVLGEKIDDYLNQKLLMDHYFWRRNLSLCRLSNEEVNMHIMFLEKINAKLPY